MKLRKNVDDEWSLQGETYCDARSSETTPVSLCGSIIVKLYKNNDEQWSFHDKDRSIIDLVDDSSSNCGSIFSLKNHKSPNNCSKVLGDSVRNFFMPTVATPCVIQKRTKWHLPECFPVLVQAIRNKRKQGKHHSTKSVDSSGLIVPIGTLNRVMKRLGGNEPTLVNCFPSNTKNSLLSSELLDVLQDIIRKRDQINNGVSRKEAIQLIVDLGQTTSNKSAENHFIS